MTADEFFTWWRSQLTELVPASLRGSWHDAKTAIQVHMQGNTVALSTPTDASTTTFQMPAAGAERPAQLTGFMARMRGTPQRIRLSLAPEEYLLRRLTLPRAAQAHLAEAVRYQLPQLTPFAADQLLYACGETADSPADGPLSVWLVAVPREPVARALGLIDQQPPDDLLPVRKPPDAGEPLTMSWSVVEGSATPQRRWQLAWLMLIILWVGAVGMHVHNGQQQQAVLDSELSAVRGQALEVSDLRNRITLAEQQVRWLSEHKQSAVSPLALLNELAERLDDETWLQGLEIQGQRVTLRGVSSSPATLIETLEASSLLQDVRFEAAITRDSRAQGDRFNISARIQAPGDGDRS